MSGSSKRLVRIRVRFKEVDVAVTGVVVGSDDGVDLAEERLSHDSVLPDDRNASVVAPYKIDQLVSVLHEFVSRIAA